jgi:hypothetical protein
VEVEPTTPAFELAKTVHALDRVATVIGVLHQLSEIMKTSLSTNVNQIKLYEIGIIYSTYGRIRNAYRIVVENPEVKISFSRRKQRWEDNIKKAYEEVGCERDARDWFRIGNSREHSKGRRI